MYIMMYFSNIIRWQNKLNQDSKHRTKRIITKVWYLQLLLKEKICHSELYMMKIVLLEVMFLKVIYSNVLTRAGICFYVSWQN